MIERQTFRIALHKSFSETCLWPVGKASLVSMVWDLISELHVGSAIWIIVPSSHGFEKYYLMGLEIQASLSCSCLKNIIKGKKSESLNAISQSADAPTAATPQETPNPSAPCIHLQHRTWKSVLGKAVVRNLNYYSKPSNSEIPAAQCDAVQGGRRQHTVCGMIHCNTQVQKVLGFPISKWE